MDPFAPPPDMDPFAPPPGVEEEDPFLPPPPMQAQADDPFSPPPPQDDPFSPPPPQDDPFLPPPDEGMSWLQGVYQRGLEGAAPAIRKQMRDVLQQDLDAARAYGEARVRAAEREAARPMAGVLAAHPGSVFRAATKLPVEDTLPVAEVLRAIFPEQSERWTQERMPAALHRSAVLRRELSALAPGQTGAIGQVFHGNPSGDERLRELQRLDAATQAMTVGFGYPRVETGAFAHGTSPAIRKYTQRAAPGPGVPPPGGGILDPERNTAAQMMGLGATFLERLKSEPLALAGDVATGAGRGLVEVVTAVPMIVGSVVTDFGPPLLRDVVRTTGAGELLNETLGLSLPTGMPGESGAVLQRALAVMGEQVGHSTADTVRDFYNPDTGEIGSFRQAQRNLVETALNVSVGLQGVRGVASLGAGVARGAGAANVVAHAVSGSAAPARGFAAGAEATARALEAVGRAANLASAGIEPFTATARLVMGGAKMTSEASAVLNGLPAVEGPRRLRAAWAAPSELMSIPITVAREQMARLGESVDSAISSVRTTAWHEIQKRDARLAKELLKAERLHKGIPEQHARRVEEVLRETNPELQFWMRRKDPEAWGGEYVPDHAILAAHGMRRVRNAQGGFETIPLTAQEQAALRASLPPGWLDDVRAEFSPELLMSGDVRGVYRVGSPDARQPSYVSNNVVNLDPALPFAAEARLELVRAGAQAVREGLLDEAVFYSRIGEYLPDLYRQWSAAYTQAMGMSPVEGAVKLSPNVLRIVGSRFRKGEWKHLAATDREMNGMIRDARFVLGKGLADIHLDIENARLFRVLRHATLDDGAPLASAHRTLRHDTELRALRTTSRYQGGSRGFGALEGMFVPREVGQYLRGMQEIPGAIGRFHDKWLNRWKWGKTVANYAGHVRQWVGNAVRADMAGSNPVLYPVAHDAYKGAWGELAGQRGAYFEQYLNAGGVGVDTMGMSLNRSLEALARNDPFVIAAGNAPSLMPLAALSAAAELAALGVKGARLAGPIRRTTARVVDAARAVGRKVGRPLANAGRKVIDAHGAAWQFGDNYFRYVRFKHITMLQEEFARTGVITREMRRNLGADAERVLRARGADKGLEAMREAKRIAGDYRDLSSAIRVVRRNAIPFVGYSWQAWPEMARFLREHPLQAAAYQQTFQGLQWFSALEGAPPEEIDAHLGEMDRLGLSRWSNQGSIFRGRRDVPVEGGGVTPQHEYLAGAYYGPAGGAISGGGVAGDSIPYALGGIGHPLAAFANVHSNRDSTTGKDIVPGGKPGFFDSGTTGDEWGDYKLPYLARQILPENPAVPGSRGWQKISAALQGKGDWRQRIRTLPEVTADVLAGYRTDLVDIGAGEDEIARRAGELHESVETRQRDDRRGQKQIKTDEEYEREHALIEQWQSRTVREARARARAAQALRDAYLEANR
ncbi:MAG: hypothetical protein AMXMBFR64_62170 [Myxococcales bacterium]